MLATYSAGYMFDSPVNARLGISLTDAGFRDYLCDKDTYVQEIRKIGSGANASFLCANLSGWHLPATKPYFSSKLRADLSPARCGVCSKPFSSSGSRSNPLPPAPSDKQQSVTQPRDELLWPRSLQQQKKAEGYDHQYFTFAQPLQQL